MSSEFFNDKHVKNPVTINFSGAKTLIKSYIVNFFKWQFAISNNISNIKMKRYVVFPSVFLLKM